MFLTLYQHMKNVIHHSCLQAFNTTRSLFLWGAKSLLLLWASYCCRGRNEVSVSPQQNLQFLSNAPPQLCLLVSFCLLKFSPLLTSLSVDALPWSFCRAPCRCLLQSSGTFSPCPLQTTGEMSRLSRDTPSPSFPFIYCLASVGVSLL